MTAEEIERGLDRLAPALRGAAGALADQGYDAEAAVVAALEENETVEQMGEAMHRHLSGFGEQGVGQVIYSLQFAADLAEERGFDSQPFYAVTSYLAEEYSDAQAGPVRLFTD